tara:strand:- start:712 stop:1164 length:453 start_codon:yes stop_codon:yes gene_type:complete
MDAPLSNPCQHFRVQAVLFNLHAIAQRGFVVAIKHRNCTLGKNGAGVHAFIDKMNRAPGDACLGQENISMCMPSGKVRQERGVDVNDAMLPFVEKNRRQQSHVPSQNNEFNVVVGQSFDDLKFVFFARNVLTISSVLHHKRRKTKTTRPF